MTVEGAVLERPVKQASVVENKKAARKRYNLIPWYVEAFSTSGVPGKRA